jgi:hypothetical protein
MAEPEAVPEPNCWYVVGCWFRSTPTLEVVLDLEVDQRILTVCVPFTSQHTLLYKVNSCVLVISLITM